MKGFRAQADVQAQGHNDVFERRVVIKQTVNTVSIVDDEDAYKKITLRSESIDEAIFYMFSLPMHTQVLS